MAHFQLSVLLLLSCIILSRVDCFPTEKRVYTQKQQQNHSVDIENYDPYSGNSTAYYDALYYKIQNLRYAKNTKTKPEKIFFPTKISDFIEILQFAKIRNVQVLLRSGGHSYEGLSSVSDVSFLIVDLQKWNNVSVDLEAKTATAQSGTTLGKLYYEINTASKGRFGFSAGTCPTVGTGGHISGGGFGLLSRKYGLAADNVVDILFMDYNGTIYNKRNMSEDLFWSLRGGGGGQFGIVLEWTVRILPVPDQVTVFNKAIFGRNQSLDLTKKWQTIGPYASDDIYLSVSIAGFKLTEKKQNLRHPNAVLPLADDIRATFHGQSLLPANETLDFFQNLFPELGMNSSNLISMSWIDSIVHFSGLSPNATALDLLNSENLQKGYFKGKSDYVQTPMNETGLQIAFKYLGLNLNGYILLNPYGGYMWKIPSTELPFPHRRGNLYSIQYEVLWNPVESPGETNIAWLQSFYASMQAFVSQNPRRAYINYLDLDLGTSRNGTTNVTTGARWGDCYFTAENYARLIKTKNEIDPTNFFRNAQSLGMKR